MKQAKTYRPQCELLENRSMLAGAGVPWGDPRHLTLSFAPDGTQIAGHTSNLTADLDAMMATADWKLALLRAVQTWAVRSNVNIGVVGDGGQAFGVAGRTQGDSRFGDIRVGDQQMSSEVSAVSVLHDPFLSGTLAGDVFLNSSVPFTSDSLLAVALHEFGHTLGLEENNDPSSVMNAAFGALTKLSTGDIAHLQALYGKRAGDANEGSNGNDTADKATQISFSQNHDDSTPLVVWGDITNSTDRDFFALKVPSDQDGPITIRLQSRGISLLAPRLTVFDANGNWIGNAASTNPEGDTVTLRLPHVNPGQTYYLRVMGATPGLFGVGSYGLAVSFDDSVAVDARTIESRLRSDAENLSADDVDEIFRDPATALLNDDGGTNDDFAEATTLQTSPGYAAKTHYETLGSLSSITDVDLFRIDAADVPSNANVVTVTALASDIHGTVPAIRLFDGNMQPVKSTILANGNGTFTIQAVGLKPGAHYFVRATSSHQRIGNYTLTIEFGQHTANLSTYASGSLDGGQQKVFDFYVAQSQLMSLLLSAKAVAPAGVTKLDVFTAAGQLVYSLTAAANSTVSGSSPFFTPGAYKVRVQNRGSVPVNFALDGASISDPLGPVISDPTTDPLYLYSSLPLQFVYPGGTITTSPTYWTPAPNTRPSSLQLTAGKIQATGLLTITGKFVDPDFLDTHKVTITWGSQGTSVLNLAAGITAFAAGRAVTGSGPLLISVKVTDLQNSSVTKSVWAYHA